MDISSLPSRANACAIHNAACRPPPPARPVKASAIFGDAVLDGGPVDGCGL
jgi:hypothetical protein